MKDSTKTISARLPMEDIKSLQLICEQHRLNQSEVIRHLIQSFIKQHGASESVERINEALKDKELFTLKEDIEAFYENFKMLNQVKESEILPLIEK